MNYFERLFSGADDQRGVPEWYRPGMGLEDAHRAISALPLCPDFGVENPSEPRLNVWVEDCRPGSSFLEVRLREVVEGYSVEHGTAYWEALLAQRVFDRTFLLWHDRELREELIWELFSFPGTQQGSFTNADKFVSTYSTWADAIAALADESLLDRGRLLDETLAALNRGFPAYRARWFSQHYNDFAPTKDDTRQRQHLLIAALGTGVSTTVSFAIRELSRISGLNEERFVPAAAHALTGPKKTALTALGMLEKVEGVPASEVAAAAVHGLSSDKDDVARRAARLIRDLGHDELLSAHRGELSPALQEELFGDAATWSADAPELPAVEPEPLEPWTDEDALFRTRELMANPTAQGFELFLAWLSATGPEALELLAEVLPKEDSQSTNAAKRLLWHCLYSDDPDFARDQFLPVPVVDIVRGEAKPRVVLSTPTDSFGRLDNSEFERRLASYDSADEISRTDLMLARARLIDYSPDNPVFVQTYEWVWRPDHDAPVKRWTRTADGWEVSDSAPDPSLPIHIATYSPDGPELPARVAFAAPTCLGAFLHAWENDLEGCVDQYPHFDAAGVLDVLHWHPGEWTGAAARFLGLAMSHQYPEVRSHAAELVATNLASRVEASTAAEALRECGAVKLNRWTSALSDAASINPSYVHALLVELLPGLDRKARNLAGLVDLAHNLHLAVPGAEISADLRAWLEGFTGRSKAAQSAKKWLEG